MGRDPSAVGTAPADMTSSFACTLHTINVSSPHRLFFSREQWLEHMILGSGCEPRLDSPGGSRVEKDGEIAGSDSDSESGAGNTPVVLQRN